MMITEMHWATQSSYPILASLQILPLIVALLIGFFSQSKRVYTFAIIASIAEFLLAIDLYRTLDSNISTQQLVEHIDWFSPLVYHASADGLTVLFMLLTSLLCLLLIGYAKVRKLPNLARFIVIIFATEACLQSVFAVQDLLWFTLASAMELILVGYLLRGWANAPQEDLAMHRYLQFMGTGLLLLFMGTLMLGWNYAGHHDGQWTFELSKLVGIELNESVEVIIFFLLFYGLAIRVPLFPLHGWLPLMAEHGTVAVAGVFLLGLKTGIYGLLRYVFPIVPDAVYQWSEWVVVFAVIGIFYAALLALVQTNLRRLLAFAVVSHTSVLIIGLFSLSKLGFESAIMLSVNYGLATATLLFMTGFIFRRTHTMSLSRLGGLFDHIPLIGVTFLLGGLSIIGMPGTPGFDAAHLMLEASIERFGALITIAAALGNVAAAGFLLWAFQRAFLTTQDITKANKDIEPVTSTEKIISLLLIFILLASGFYSEIWMQLIEAPTTALSLIYEPYHAIDH